ncbi:MAG: phosphoesterase [Sulfurimonas sp.]|uniref:DHH family phosphoesterase n=1 Tax=Sulfurimonas sp. TaxID=2022749 RepID=UPI0025EE7BB2|nr:phosphoesterase [Sulfurimonas sp.]MCK9490790.1 phosphoesterase [Sulfurimonas sp.]
MCNKINILNKIAKAKKVMIVTDAKNLALSCALYTYVLMQHKSVSLICEDENLDASLSFLPWFEMIKSKKILSADLTIEMDFTSLEFFTYLKGKSEKINKKMATALYASLLQESEGFLIPDANGMVFAMAKELIDIGAEYKLCTKGLLQTKSLALLRLKSLMFKSMILQNNAKAAIFTIRDDDLKSSGASIKDCDEVLKEALHLPLVELAVLLDSKNEIIKIKER